MLEVKIGVLKVKNLLFIILVLCFLLNTKTMNKLRQARHFFFNFVISLSPVFDIHLQNIPCCKCRLSIKNQ